MGYILGLTFTHVWNFKLSLKMYLESLPWNIHFLFPNEEMRFKVNLGSHTLDSELLFILEILSKKTLQLPTHKPCTFKSQMERWLIPGLVIPWDWATILNNTFCMVRYMYMCSIKFFGWANGSEFILYHPTPRGTMWCLDRLDFVTFIVAPIELIEHFVFSMIENEWKWIYM